MLVNKTSHKFTGKLGQKVDRTKCGHNYKISLPFLYIIGKIWREVDNKWTKHSIIMFASAWILQFIGHAIEGNRPALMTSLSQTVFQAPLLTLEYVYPNLLA